MKFLKLYCEPHSLVLVLNASGLEVSKYFTCTFVMINFYFGIFLQNFFSEELCNEGVTYPPKIITNEYSAKER